MQLIYKVCNSILKIFNLKISRYKHTFDELIDQLVVTNEPVFFDIGGNKGQSIKRFKNIRSNCEIHTFEPLPDLYKYLLNNFKNENINIINKALGSKIETKKIFLNNLGNYGAMSSFYKLKKNSLFENEYRKLNKDSNKISDQQLEVSVITVDQYIEKNNIGNVDYMKIDVQGWESEVLEGAANSLKSKKIKNIELEYALTDGYEASLSISKFENILMKYNYKLIAINNHGDVINNPILNLDLLYQLK